MIPKEIKYNLHYDDVSQYQLDAPPTYDTRHLRHTRLQHPLPLPRSPSPPPPTHTHESLQLEQSG